MLMYLQMQLIAIIKSKSSKMNFSFFNQGGNEYNKIMMQKHLDMKRRRRQYWSRNVFTSPNQNNNANSTQSIHNAGVMIVNSGLFNNSSILSQSWRPEQDSTRMKKMMRNQLQQSLVDQENTKMKTLKEKTEKNTENGMLDYLQKQIEKRDNFIKACIANQEKNKDTFLNDDLRKKTMIQAHVMHNYDPNRFYHESEKYQNGQKKQLEEVKKINQSQVIDRKMAKKQEQKEYRSYLDERYLPSGHNPITNPLEYHIQNPYIKRQIQFY